MKFWIKFECDVFFLLLFVGWRPSKPWNGTRSPPSLTLAVEATPSPWVKGPPVFFLFSSFHYAYRFSACWKLPPWRRNLTIINIPRNRLNQHFQGITKYWTTILVVAPISGFQFWERYSEVSECQAWIQATEQFHEIAYQSLIAGVLIDWGFLGCHRPLDNPIGVSGIPKLSTIRRLYRVLSSLGVKVIYWAVFGRLSTISNRWRQDLKLP